MVAGKERTMKGCLIESGSLGGLNDLQLGL